MADSASQSYASRPHTILFGHAVDKDHEYYHLGFTTDEGGFAYAFVEHDPFIVPTELSADFVRFRVSVLTLFEARARLETWAVERGWTLKLR